MNSYINPDVILYDSPVGPDAAIQAVQLIVGSKVSFLQTVFGRAIKQEESKIKNDISSRGRIYYPECYGKNGEPINVMPNDNLAAYCFFYIVDPTTSIDYAVNEYNHYKYNANIVVWANTKKIDADVKRRATSEYIQDILNAFRSIYDIEVKEIYESFENVFSNYTITEDYRQYMKFPYTAFRISFDLSAREQCTQH